MHEKPSIRLKFKNSLSSTDVAESKPRPSLLGTEPVLAKCGHTIAFELYVKDAFRDQRRTKAMQRDCPACRQARVKADALAAKERRANKPTAHKPRLPDGARFAATYDAAKVQWTGTLTVDGVTFERQGSSLSKLLHKLDDVYRATKTPPAASANQEPAAAPS